MVETLLGNLKGPKGDKGDYATIDSQLSSSSTNPVQNKAIKSALDGKSNSNHSHNVVTAESNGLMENTMYTKLNGIESGANKTIVDSSLSSSSQNPVKNQVIVEALTHKLSILETGKITANLNNISGSISYIKAQCGEINILFVININLKFTSTTGKDTLTAYPISNRKIPMENFEIRTNWRIINGLGNSRFLFIVETDGTVKFRMDSGLNTNVAYGEATYCSIQ